MHTRWTEMDRGCSPSSTGSPALLAPRTCSTRKTSSDSVCAFSAMFGLRRAQWLILGASRPMWCCSENHRECQLDSRAQRTLHGHTRVLPDLRPVVRRSGHRRRVFLLFTPQSIFAPNQRYRTRRCSIVFRSPREGTKRRLQGLGTEDQRKYVVRVVRGVLHARGDTVGSGTRPPWAL